MLPYQVVKVGVQVVEGGVLRYQRSTGVLGHAQLLRVVCSDAFFSRKCHRNCLILIVHELLRLVCSDIKLLRVVCSDISVRLGSSAMHSC